MRLKTKIVIICFLVIILALLCGGSWLYVFGGVRKFSTDTHTIKTGERNVKKLITSTQFIDFVTVIISGDRSDEYIEYQTYKIEAGIDLENDKSTVRIINPPSQLDRTVIRAKMSAENYDSYVKPIREAYAIKACDIAVKYGLLKNARENISDMDQNLFKINKEEVIEPKPKHLNVNKLPCYFDIDIGGGIFNEDVKRTLLRNLDLDFEDKVSSEFKRDAAEFKIKGKGDNVRIRFGYTGRKFSEDTFRSFRERLQTENKDITVFTYFDPLDDEVKKQVLSYATDHYGRAFILHEDGKLFYIDLAVDGKAAEGQIVNNLGSYVLYLAMSLQFDYAKDDISNEYISYIEDYDEALTFLRKKKYPEFKVTVEDMISQKENKLPETQEEKILCAVANYFCHDENKTLKVGDPVFDSLISNSNFLYNSHEKDGDYKSPEKRAELLRAINVNVPEVRANILTYFLQKERDFGLTEKERNDYLSELTQSALTVDRTIFESFDTDSERNEFYTDLFKNASVQNKVEAIISEEHPDMTFFFLGDTKDSVGGTGRLEEKLVKRNAGLPLGNVFVLVFSESELPMFSGSQESKSKFIQFFRDLGKKADDASKTVHCLVFDNCSVRLFTCVDDDSIFEKVVKASMMPVKLITQKHTVKIGKASVGTPEFVDFSDWRKMNVYKNGTAFLGFDFSNTATYNARANRRFQQTERAKEIRTVGEVLLQLQHAYESDDFHYELALDFVERQLRNYVYDMMWRPSLNVSKSETDTFERYNYIWTE